MSQLIDDSTLAAIFHPTNATCAPRITEVLTLARHAFFEATGDQNRIADWLEQEVHGYQEAPHHDGYAFPRYRQYVEHYTAHEAPMRRFMTTGLEDLDGSIAETLARTALQMLQRTVLLAGDGLAWNAVVPGDCAADARTTLGANGVHGPAQVDTMTLLLPDTLTELYQHTVAGGNDDESPWDTVAAHADTGPLHSLYKRLARMLGEASATSTETTVQLLHWSTQHTRQLRLMPEEYDMSYEAQRAFTSSVLALLAPLHLSDPQHVLLDLARSELTEHLDTTTFPTVARVLRTVLGRAS